MERIKEDRPITIKDDKGNLNRCIADIVSVSSLSHLHHIEQSEQPIMFWALAKLMQPYCFIKRFRAFSWSTQISEVVSLNSTHLFGMWWTTWIYVAKCLPAPCCSHLLKPDRLMKKNYLMCYTDKACVSSERCIHVEVCVILCSYLCCPAAFYHRNGQTETRDQGHGWGKKKI